MSGATCIVYPGRFGLCVYSPDLDGNGNSIAGVEFAKLLGQTLGSDF